MITQSGNLDNDSDLRLRNVENTDMGDLFKWRNHPDIRKNSFNTDTLLWVEHERWFKEKSKDPNSKIYVACYEDEKIGMVRFDEKDDVIKVSVMLNPDIIFTHYEKDLNIDHQITYQAVITATRPLPDETVKEIYSFEVLSSTDGRYPLSFSPNVFFDISETLDLKLKAMSEYKTELKDFPHPRSLEGIRKNAELWGMKSGLKYAEAFKVVRMVK